MTDPQTKSPLFSLPTAFAALSLLFGLAMLILTPPFGVPDEPHHLMRAYQVAEGHFLPIFRNNTGGDELPASLLFISDPFTASRLGASVSPELIRQALHVPLLPDRKIYMEFSNTSAYSPLVYFPQATAIAIGRPFRLSVLQLMYAARLANLLIWTATGYLALSIAPGIKRPLFLLMLTPMAMYEAASISADVVGSALAILFCALIWRQIAENTSNAIISTRRAWVLVLLAIGIGLAKFVYVPLLALPILIPTAAFGSRRRKRLIVATLIFVGTITSIWWSMQTPGLDMIANGVSKDFHPRSQVQFLRQHPSAWLTIPLHTIENIWKQQWISFVGEFGWMDARLPMLACFAYCLALFLACCPAAPDRPLARIRMWLMMIPVIVLSSLFTLGLTAYLFWTSTGAPFVTDLQGRYLIPLAPAVIMLTNVLWRQYSPQFLTQRNSAKLDWACALIAVAALVDALHVIHVRFYGVHT